MLAPFGRLSDGTDVAIARLANGRLAASLIPLGATIVNLSIDGRSVVLGFSDLASYEHHSPHFGCIAGRCANRIRDGRFELDGRTVQLTRNAGGRHHIHGGRNGFGRRLWLLESATETTATFVIAGEDGEEGYPGRVTARCRYTLHPDRLTLDVDATTDAPTLVNLAPHSYFDLDRGETILDHRLTIVAEAYVPVDAEGIPTGAVDPVAGTRFDHRLPRPVRDAVAGGVLDHNFALAAAPSSEPRFAARLEGPRSGLALEVWTTEPGLQVYDGNQLAVPVPLADGRRIGRHGGICLESQRFPDAVHHPHFPGAVLRPGEIYHQITEYRLFAP